MITKNTPFLPGGKAQLPSGITSGFLKKREPRGSWQDVCLLHSIPGDDRDEGTVVLADGSLRKYISVSGINVILTDGHDRDQLAMQFSQLINSCETDIQIIVRSRQLPVEEYLSRHKQSLKTEDPYLKLYASFTDDWFRDMQKKRFVPQREFFVVVSYTPSDCSEGVTWGGTRSRARHLDCVQYLDRLVTTAVEQLRLSNLKPRVLNRKEVRELIYFDLNPALAARDPDVPPSRSGVSEASCLALSALRVNDDSLWLDGKHVRTQYVSRLPHDTWLGWLVDLLTIRIEYTLSIFVHQCDQERVRNDLRWKYHMGRMSSRQLPAPDLETCETTRVTERAIQDFLRTSNKAVDISMYMTCKADSPAQLERHADEIRRVLKNRGASVDSGELVQLDAWQSSLPIGVDKLAVTHRVMAPIVGTMFPFFSATCGTPSGVPFGFALSSGEPVLLDPFFRGAGKDANNMFVVGTTGAGKSFAMSMMIMRLLPMGFRFVLLDKTVDKQGSYRFISDLLGPEQCAYIDLGPNSGYMLNPFDLGPEDHREGEPTQKKVANLLSLLDLMLAPEGKEELSIEEKSILDGLIRVTYRRARERGGVPTMSDLAGVASLATRRETDRRHAEMLRQLTNGLSLFTKSGAFGGLVDGYTNIDTEKPFIVFDTREINEPRLERITVYMLAEFIRRQAEMYKKNDIRFAAIIDEASTLMRFKAGAMLLDDLSRRSRHLGMMLVSITQQLKDFFKQSEIAGSVVKNAHMKLLLRQDASDLISLQETLRLKDAEVAAIERFARDDQNRKESHALLIVGAVNGTIRLVPSPMDYWVCTSEPIRDIPKRRDLIRQLKIKEPGLSHHQACRQAVYLLGHERSTIVQ